MKFEEWFYQDDTDDHKLVIDFDNTFAFLMASMECFLRKAYEAGYEQGVRDKE